MHMHLTKDMYYDENVTILTSYNVYTIAINILW